jgi:hypothetical protein
LLDSDSTGEDRRDTVVVQPCCESKSLEDRCQRLLQVSRAPLLGQSKQSDEGSVVNVQNREIEGREIFTLVKLRHGRLPKANPSSTFVEAVEVRSI